MLYVFFIMKKISHFISIIFSIFVTVKFIIMKEAGYVYILTHLCRRINATYQEHTKEQNTSHTKAKS